MMYYNSICIFLFIYSIIVFIQIVFFVFFLFNKKYQSISANHCEKPVSIIICARNESRNIQLFLRKILQQIYVGSFEVIVVNDASDDDTLQVLLQYKNEYNHLEIVNLSRNEERHLPGKKFALEKGIEKSRYENLLLTDADCEPSSPYWLQMMADIQQEKSIALGYGAYHSQQGMLNKFIRWETVHTCMQYCRLSSLGYTYMGVGRNLMYKKSLINGLKNNQEFNTMYAKTPSGDDDLIINKIANKTNVAVCLNKKAITISVPKKTWKEWWIQKTRHVSTGKYYKTNVKIILGMYALSHSLFWILSLMALLLTLSGFITKNMHIVLFIMFFARLLLYWINATNWYYKLDEKKLAWFYPFGDFGWFIYNIIISPYIFWKNKKLWK